MHRLTFSVAGGMASFSLAKVLNPLLSCAGQASSESNLLLIQLLVLKKTPQPHWPPDLARSATRILIPRTTHAFGHEVQRES